jgi:hypothetical protein
MELLPMLPECEVLGQDGLGHVNTLTGITMAGATNPIITEIPATTELAAIIICPQ